MSEKTPSPMTLLPLRLLLALLLTVLPLQRTAAFSALYVFGDGVCTTTDNVSGEDYFYGNRYCNGRVWVEVLAQWQGLAYDASKNKSFFGHFSTALKTNVNSFVAPPNAATSLFIVWCNNADFVKITSDLPPPYTLPGPSLQWTARMNQSIEDHKTAISTLYSKGARTIIMPKAVNITKTPSLSGMASNSKEYVRLRTIEYNAAFEAGMISLAGTKPGLKIYFPDAYGLFEQALATPSAFGLTNTTGYGLSVITNQVAVGPNSPGSTYLFWDDTHPTARFQMYLADLAQKMISPVKLNGLSRSGTISQLTIANIPLGRQGIVEGSSNLLPPWNQDVTFTQPFTAGGSTTGSVNATSTAPSRFYRVKFPVVWTWP
jgi:hypothetical protein